ncbi:MAG: tetratricopeptide repeat protein, partial [Candidatus Wallbacteria bacterium]|nr:tetratricopeptide repeat protein [Candidatus Wallbacteria bacterium]
MRIPHALLIAGLLLPVSSSDVACAGRPPQREPIVSRKGSPIPPVEEEGSGWTGLIARARKALDARQPEKVLELLETPTIEDKAPPPEAVQLLARAYLAFDRGDDAEAVVDHGLKGQPNSRELKAIRADLEVSLGKRKLEEGVYKLAR